MLFRSVGSASSSSPFPPKESAGAAPRRRRRSFLHRLRPTPFEPIAATLDLPATVVARPRIEVAPEEPCRKRVAPALCRLAEVVVQGARGSRSQDGDRDSRSRCRPEGHRRETERTKAWTTPGQGQSMGCAWDAMSELMVVLPGGPQVEQEQLVEVGATCTWDSSRDNSDLDAIQVGAAGQWEVDRRREQIGRAHV